MNHLTLLVLLRIVFFNYRKNIPIYCAFPMFMKTPFKTCGSFFGTIKHYNTALKHGFNVKRNFDKIKREEEHTILKKLLTNRTIKSPKDVEHLRCEVLNSEGKFSEKNVDRTLLKHFSVEGHYRNGLNYIKFLNEEIKSKLNLVLTNNTFRLYFYERHRNKNLSAVEGEYLISLYEDLRRSFPVLDIYSLESALLGLSVTKDWKKCLDLLQEMSKIDGPSNICYNAIIASAFLNGEEEMAWTFVKQMFDNHKAPSIIAFRAYMELLEQIQNKDEIMMKVNKLFTECKEKDLIFSEEVIGDLKNILSRNLIQANLTSINKRGYCLNCHQKLEEFEVTNERFEKLKENMIANVIVGKNIFTKTTPEEFKRFQNFLATTDNCTVVMDGLNVAYSVGTKHSNNVSSAMLAHVVAYFVNRDMKVLVLGREHMNRWPKKNWDYVKNNAQIFLTQNLSQDDPYLLYAALHFGKNTIIVTRDLMRSHLFLLKDPDDKIMLSRWLSQRQYQVKFVSGFGKVNFEDPIPFARTMQKNGNHLHIPYQTKKEKNNEHSEISNCWFCIQCS